MKTIVRSLFCGAIGVMTFVLPAFAATTVPTPVVPYVFDVKFNQINIGGGPRCTSVLSTFIATFSHQVDPLTINPNTVFVLGPNDVPVVGSYAFLQLDSLKKGLKIGSTGPDVKKLQIFLFAMGYFPDRPFTQTFGSVTQKALTDWQKSLGIKATGVLDTATIAYAHVLVFTPAGPLQEDAEYSMAAAAEVKDIFGNSLSGVFRRNMVTDVNCKSSEVLSRGIRGLQGIQGIEGLIGVQGIQGLQGIQGIPGTTSFGGPQGKAGTQGTQGNQGLQGFTGATGTQGERGERGPSGSAGATGAGGSTTIVQGLLPHATITDSTSQTVSSETDIRAITYNTNNESYLIDHALGDSRIYTPAAGVYGVAISAQMYGGGVIDLWMRKNGVDVPNSNNRVTIQNGYIVLTYPFTVRMAAGDYIEFMQVASNSGTGLVSIPAQIEDPIMPTVPSAIVAIIRVSD